MTVHPADYVDAAGAPPRTPRPPLRWLIPSIEVTVLVVAGGLVLATALAVSANASSNLEEGATAEAVSAVKAVVHAYVDPLLSTDLLGSPDAVTAASINHQLELLTGSGSILRIKVWSPTGTVVFSDLPALRGRTFDIDADLAEALEGHVEADIGDAVADENVFELAFTTKLLEIYLPIGAEGEEPVGAYEIYQDATELEALLATTRQQIFLIVGGIGLVLLVTLYLAFHGAGRLVAELSGRLRRSETRFRSLVQNSSDLVVLLDREARMVFVSPAIERILGEPAATRSDQPVTELVHPEDAEWITALLERLAATPGSVSRGEVRMQHADGRWRWIEVVGTNLMSDPDVRGIVLNCRDVTDRRTLEEQLRHQAFHDPLTNLANRPLLIDRIEHELEGRPMESPATTAVLLLDLDDFKTVNDSLGHTAGDELLAAVADRVRAALRGRDTAARIGGDEFGILVRTGERAEVEAIAERILGSIREPIDLGDHHLTVAASMGIVYVDGRQATADELLRSADVAMYMAKARGKDRFVVFEASMHDAAVRRLRLKADLEHGLEAGQFHLLYQPIIDLASGGPVGLEALLRWNHPSWMIGPSEFVPFAEETGMIIPLGRWVLEEACRHAVALEATPAGRGLDVSVNVSAVQLARHEFPDEVAAVLKATGLDPSRLIIELTESVLLDREGAPMTSLTRLHELGIRLAIDDFGTGYSSLSYLHDLPIDILKIDISFVAALDAGREAPAVVRSIIRLAGTLGLHTIAEGIERPEQAGRLRTLGADYGQGFHFAPPLSAEELATYLRERAWSPTAAEA
ncbi:MAG: EAL domain-containing protein [Chloroflexi bacterium]|nr:EAL domain-containing protein [Chloroflexota bacterium]